MRHTSNPITSSRPSPLPVAAALCTTETGVALNAPRCSRTGVYLTHSIFLVRVHTLGMTTHNKHPVFVHLQLLMHAVA